MQWCLSCGIDRDRCDCTEPSRPTRMESLLSSLGYAEARVAELKELIAKEQQHLDNEPADKQ